MELIGAIDLLGGRARRLEQGDYGRPISRSADPIGLAASWLAAGLRRLHVVDLDGARDGQPDNGALIAELARLAAQYGASVQAGGGLRDPAAVEGTLGAGVDTVMLGSAAVRRPQFVAECAQRWPGRIGVSLDLRAWQPATDGWRGKAAAEPLALAATLLDMGASRLAVTDIERDGMGAGPNLELSAAFRRRFTDAVLLSAGGIASAEDLAALARLGMDGAIVGRALLEGSVDIGAALLASAGAAVA